jgi:hypothetical protein
MTMGGKALGLAGAAAVFAAIGAVVLAVSWLLLHLPPLDWTLGAFLLVAGLASFLTAMPSVYIFPTPIPAFVAGLSAYWLALRPDVQGHWPPILAYVAAMLTAALAGGADMGLISYMLLRQSSEAGDLVAFGSMALLGCYVISFAYFFVLLLIRQAAGF